jgi:hypothetical protein
MSKIARDLNVKNIEERVFELEKNPSGGSDERVDNFLEKNFNQSAENIPIGCTFIDNEQQIKAVYSEKKNQTTGEVELSIVPEKNLQIPVNSGRLQLYIDGYIDDLTDATHKVTPVYDTADMRVDYDLTKIPNIDKFNKVGVKYTDGLYHNDLEKNIKKCFQMAPQVWSINTPENMIGLASDIQDFNIRLYFDGFSEKTAFNGLDFRLNLKIAKTVVENGTITEKNGFFISSVNDVILANDHTEYAVYPAPNPELIHINNSQKLNNVYLWTTKNIVDNKTIIETSIVIDSVNIEENDFAYSYLDIYCKSAFGKYLETNS